MPSAIRFAEQQSLSLQISQKVWDVWLLKNGYISLIFQMDPFTKSYVSWIFLKRLATLQKTI